MRVSARRIGPVSQDPARAGRETEAPDDGALLAGTANHDALAFRELVERHLPSLLGVARRMLKDDAEAEDVAQEALLRLWRSAGTLTLGPAGARPWLRRVVSNMCIDRIRAVKRTDVTDEAPDQEVDAEQLKGLLDGELSTRVDAALKAIPERQRLALTLFHYEGLSQVEVGEVLGVSDEAVESLLSRARRTMRELLRDEWRQLLRQEE
jgi:RNA polymerase sigma-70 factor (ECF subfamily)